MFLPHLFNNMKALLSSEEQLLLQISIAELGDTSTIMKVGCVCRSMRANRFFSVNAVWFLDY